MIVSNFVKKSETPPRTRASNTTNPTQTARKTAPETQITMLTLPLEFPPKDRRDRTVERRGVGNAKRHNLVSAQTRNGFEHDLTEVLPILGGKLTNQDFNDLTGGLGLLLFHVQLHRFLSLAIHDVGNQSNNQNQRTEHVDNRGGVSSHRHNGNRHRNKQSKMKT